MSLDHRRKTCPTGKLAVVNKHSFDRRRLLCPMCDFAANRFDNEGQIFCLVAPVKGRLAVTHQMGKHLNLQHSPTACANTPTHIHFHS